MVNTRDETGATGEDSGILPPHISSSCQESSGLHGPSVEMPFQNTQLGGGLSTRNRMNNQLRSMKEKVKNRDGNSIK